MKVVIAGAGIGGLTLALSLQAAGIEAEIHEAVAELKPLGVGVNLLPHAVRELTELGLAQDLAARGVATEALIYTNKLGQEIWREPRGRFAGYDWPQYSIHRGVLQMLLARTVRATIAKAAQVPQLATCAAQLEQALQEVLAATQAAWATGKAHEALANAVPYMQAFGHMVLAWTWLDVAHAVLERDASVSAAANAGRMGAMRYFFRYELPKIGAWLQVVNQRDMTCADLPEAAF